MSNVAILLVDDEKIVLDSLRAELRTSFGNRFVYEAAENVNEAWEVIEELHEDGTHVVVVVSDWLMPGMRGDEFLTQVRERYPGVVRIMLTGQADDAAIQRALQEAGVYRVLKKPWRAEELKQTIEGGLRT